VHLVSVCRDSAAEAAMSLAWPGTVHLICDWHFMKNVKEKLYGRLGGSWEASAVGDVDLMFRPRDMSSRTT
jgi:hypothetical protein